MLSIVFSLILVGFIVGLPAAWLARGIGRRLNALDGAGVAGQVKAAPRRVPNTGGIGIFATIVLPMLLGLWFFHGLDTSPNAAWRTDFSFVPADVEPYAAGIQQQIPSALVLLGSLLVLHAMGIVDDRRPLGPMVKLPVMLLASIMAVIGTDSRLLTLLDGYGAAGHWGSVAITVLWVVVITNAFNFLDNMDGLSGGVAAICAAAFLTTAIVGGQWFVAAVLALLLGALIGFLRFNFPLTTRGASMFMGDSGSLVIGFLLAVMAVRITYVPSVPGQGPVTQSTLLPGPLPPHSHLLLAPLIILAVPLYDFCSVCVLRIRQGRSPFVGDLQHFSHRLVRHGLTRRSAVLVIYGCTAVTGIGAIALPRLEMWQGVLVGVQTLLVLLVIALYEWARPPGEARA